MVLLVIAAAATTLTVAFALSGVTNKPYQQTRLATAGPDVVAIEGGGPGPAQPVSSAQLAAAVASLTTAPGVIAHSGPYPTAYSAVRFRRAHGGRGGRRARPGSGPGGPAEGDARGLDPPRRGGDRARLCRCAWRSRRRQRPYRRPAVPGGRDRCDSCHPALPQQPVPHRLPVPGPSGKLRSPEHGTRVAHPLHRGRPRQVGRPSRLPPQPEAGGPRTGSGLRGPAPGTPLPGRASRARSTP